MFDLHTDILEKGISKDLAKSLKSNASKFVTKCKKDYQYKLTKKSDVTGFSNCFGVLLSNFIGDSIPNEEKNVLADSIYDQLNLYKDIRSKECISLNKDKYFMQLLAFVLSVFDILDIHYRYPLSDLIESLLPNNMEEYLSEINAHKGTPQSGNLAMCVAIFAIYSNEFLNMSNQKLVSDWLNFHKNNLNEFGFWGKKSVSHLQFQNGYHQYEIFDYLNEENLFIDKSIEMLKIIADSRGQFAPYYGGSGCYDYDAISILTYSDRTPSYDEKKLFLLTLFTILGEVNDDGGFSESKWLRPRNIENLIENFKRCFTLFPELSLERLRYFISLIQPKNNFMHTHWTNYSREWGESNTWDTWFRLQTIAKIDIALSGENKNNWKFTNFPGIGYRR